MRSMMFHNRVFADLNLSPERVRSRHPSAVSVFTNGWAGTCTNIPYRNHYINKIYFDISRGQFHAAMDASFHSARVDTTIRGCDARDIGAVTDIYRHHVLHALATFEIDPPGAEEMA